MGAGDGIEISNTYYFHKKYNFNRLLLEGDLNKIKKQKKILNTIL